MSPRKKRTSKPKEPRHRVRPKTYSLALILVGLFILFQIIAIGSVFWLRRAVVKIETSALAQEIPMRLHVSDVAPTAEEQAAHDSADEQIEAWTQPSGRLDIRRLASRQKKLDELYRQAEEFAAQKQLGSAKAVLQKALKIAPEDPAALIRLARLEESISNFTEAAESWQRIELVAQKIENGELEKFARERLVWLNEQSRRAAVREELRKRLLALPKKIFVDHTTFMPSPLPTDPSEFEAEFSIRSTLATITPEKMRLQVFFYDVLPNGRLLSAKVHAAFDSPSPSWTTNQTEKLKVNYQRDSEPAGRRYYGYILRLIYEDEVQYEQAEPQELLHLMTVKK